jgi:TldD protein
MKGLQTDPWEFAELALNYLSDKAVTYADVRQTFRLSEHVESSNGVPGNVGWEEDAGFGIRVLVDGAWGFAASPDCSPEEARRVAKLALEVGKASARLQRTRIHLAPQKGMTDTFKTPLEIDPFSIPVEKRLELLTTATLAASKRPKVRSAYANMVFNRHQSWFYSTDNARIHQDISTTGINLSVRAGSRHGMQSRSYPSSHGGDTGTGGYERILSADLPGHAEQTAEEAVALLSAPDCPQGEFTVIIHGDQMGMQLHETVGHPLELDRVFGAEANFSGTSFATPEKCGQLKYASDIVTIVTDPTEPGGLGSYKYDDDGVPAQRTDLIRDGILVGYLSGRETAATLNTSSSANNRAAGWRHFPINRMSNTNLVPGNWRLQDLIEDTESGLYLVTNKSWSIDDRRESFHFECEMAYEIKNGKRGTLLKNPVYSGRTVPFWNSCDAICNRDEYRIWGTPNCGKGEPSQNMYTGQGASPCRFRNVTMGTSNR